MGWDGARKTPSTHRNDKLVKFPKEGGMLPFRKLLERSLQSISAWQLLISGNKRKRGQVTYNHWSFVNRPSSGGMLPTKLFETKYLAAGRTCIRFSSVRRRGVHYTYKKLSRFKLPNSTGIVPLKKLSLRSLSMQNISQFSFGVVGEETYKLFKLSSDPSSYGISPSRLFEYKYLPQESSQHWDSKQGPIMGAS